MSPLPGLSVVYAAFPALTRWANECRRLRRLDGGRTAGKRVPARRCKVLDSFEVDPPAQQKQVLRYAQDDKLYKKYLPVILEL